MSGSCALEVFEGRGPSLLVADELPERNCLDRIDINTLRGAEIYDV